MHKEEKLDRDQVTAEDSNQIRLRKMSPEEKKEHDKLLDELEAAIGAYCEIRGLDNLLAVIGHVERVERDKGSITIRSAEREMPIVIFNTSFKLMIRPRGGKHLVMNGKVCGSNKDIWKLDHLSRYFYNESRSFFRQPADTSGYAAVVNALYHPSPETEAEPIVQARLCRVMDISLQGIQIRAKEAWFEAGDWLLLTDIVLVPQQERSHNFLCQVRRTQPTGRGEFLFGCQFLSLMRKEQDLLCADIFALNRLDIQACRFGQE